MKNITIAIEGESDHGVVRSVVNHCGFEVSIVVGRRGKDHIRKNIHQYNQAARTGPWFVLVDLDNVNDCPVTLRQKWLPSAANSNLIFNVAVAEVEAWMLADRERMAEFLGVSIAKLPLRPDEIGDPKELVINLARASQRRDIREGLVPRRASGAPVGPTYVSEMYQFGAGRWRPSVAAELSPSLARCLARLARLDNES